MKKVLFSAITQLLFLPLLSAGISYSAAGGGVKSLDPALADDLAGRDLTALCYDTLVQYDYLARPYKLIPGMLKKMPELSPDGRSYLFELQENLYFAPHPALPDKKSRKITSYDVKFSILRIADSRHHSPLYWLYRNRISGIGDFRKKSAAYPKGDYSFYNDSVPGIKILDERKFILTLDRPESGFLYLLAMPNAGIVSSRAALAVGNSSLSRKPAGSGPFILKEWIPNLRLKFVRNPEFRKEFFPQAESAADRKKPLPLLDGIEISQIRQNMTAWMLFLQGNLDCNALDKDNCDTLAGNGELIPALKKRGVILDKIPEFEIRYIGFNFNDPLLKNNLFLRRALREAYDIQRRVKHASNMLIPAAGPIPEGISGFVPADEPHVPDLKKALKLLEVAGYPKGIDPASGKALQLSFDQAGSSVNHRQMGELAQDDFRKIGIDLLPALNSRPRFTDKLRRGQFQLFRYSWIGDYPDALNFLQLFYSGNRGSCNYCGFADARFDKLYEEALALGDCVQKDQLIARMVKLLDDECVWIWEGFPVSFALHYNWLENSVPHDFSFVRWKYLSVNDKKRTEMKKKFKPLSFRELSGKEEDRSEK